MTKRSFNIMSILVLVLMFVAVFSPRADAKSSYLSSCMTAANATGCHPSAAGIAGKAPTLTSSDCKSCHHHGLSTTPVVTTDKTTYALTDNILFKFTGGSQSGRAGLVIYNLAGTSEVARGVIAEDGSATLSVPASAFGAITSTAIKTKWHGNSINTTNGANNVCTTQVPCSAHDFSAVINTPAITITTGCTRVAPAVTFSATAQSVNAGGSVTYTATVTNNDTTACSSSTFALSLTETGTSANFVLPSTLSTTSCSNLAPGGKCTSTLTVKAQSAATAGATNVTTVRAADATNHSTQTGSGAVTTTISSGVAEACQDGKDNDLNGLIDCADPVCAADASCLNPNHKNINAYNGPSTCIACHSAAGTQVLNSMHGSWTGPTPNVTNINGDSGKWKQTNNYCTDPELADYGCVKCHVSTAAKVLNKDGMVDLSPRYLSANEMDCLQCHQTNYFATFMPNSDSTSHTSCVDGSVRTYKIPLPEADGKIHKVMRLDLAPAGATALSLARTVHRPNNATCVTKCHAAAGGADGVKRGDIDSTMANPPVTTDVHLSSAGTAKLTCTSCHAGTGHQIPGRGNDMRGEDVGAVIKKCVDCHASMGTSTGHGTSTTQRQAANRHIAKVDCTACHIDSYGKGIPTEMSRDWTKPMWSPSGCEGQGAWVGTPVKASNVVPEYRFWNKTSWVYDRNGRSGLTTDLIDGGLAMSYPLGGMADGKLYPFKVHTSNNPIDDGSGKTNFDVLSMFMDGCFDKAAVQGLAFIKESGAYTWKTNKAFQLITHGVAPKATANNCAKCHGTIDTSTVSKLDKLGYKTPKPTSDLCNDCHSLKTNTNHVSLHDYHVRSKGINCSSCHNFSR